MGGVEVRNSGFRGRNYLRLLQRRTWTLDARVFFSLFPPVLYHLPSSPPTEIMAGNYGTRSTFFRGQIYLHRRHHHHLVSSELKPLSPPLFYWSSSPPSCVLSDSSYIHPPLTTPSLWPPPSDALSLLKRWLLTKSPLQLGQLAGSSPLLGLIGPIRNMGLWLGL